MPNLFVLVNIKILDYINHNRRFFPLLPTMLSYSKPEISCAKQGKTKPTAYQAYVLPLVLDLGGSIISLYCNSATFILRDF